MNPSVSNEEGPLPPIAFGSDVMTLFPFRQAVLTNRTGAARGLEVGSNFSVSREFLFGWGLPRITSCASSVRSFAFSGIKYASSVRHMFTQAIDCIIKKIDICADT